MHKDITRHLGPRTGWGPARTFQRGTKAISPQPWGRGVRAEVEQWVGLEEL